MLCVLATNNTKISRCRCSSLYSICSFVATSKAVWHVFNQLIPCIFPGFFRDGYYFVVAVCSLPPRPARNVAGTKRTNDLYRRALLAHRESCWRIGSPQLLLGWKPLFHQRGSVTSRTARLAKLAPPPNRVPTSALRDDDVRRPFRRPRRPMESLSRGPTRVCASFCSSIVIFS